ncbi:hypothetical protein BGZ95_008039, partial [Linnemannia exigua]
MIKSEPISRHPDFLAFKDKLSVRLKEADRRRSEAAPEAPANLAPSAAKYIRDLLDNQRQQYTTSMCKWAVETKELKAEVMALKTELANRTNSFKSMMEAMIQLLNSGFQSSSQHSPIGYHPLIIAEQVKYDSRVHSNGPVPQNIAKIISNRRPVALYAYFLARTKFKSSQKEVEDAATATDNTKTHSVIKYLQNEKDSKFKRWASFFSWCLERLQQEGRKSSDADTIKYLDKRESIA